MSLIVVLFKQEGTNGIAVIPTIKAIAPKERPRRIHRENSHNFLKVPHYSGCRFMLQLLTQTVVRVAIKIDTYAMGVRLPLKNLRQVKGGQSWWQSFILFYELFLACNRASIRYFPQVL
eukprot:scaffold776_cov347-Pavlova_lutheri.AAC.64